MTRSGCPAISTDLSPHAHAQVEYDVMDLGEPRFREDFLQFKGLVKDLERRLASVIIQVRMLGAPTVYCNPGQRICVSWGQQSRLALTCTLVCAPPILQSGLQTN